MATPLRTRHGLPTPTGDPVGQREFLRTTKEILEIAQRQRGDPLKSFTRLDEMTSLGLADQYGNIKTGLVTDIVDTATLVAKRLRAYIHFSGN